MHHPWFTSVADASNVPTNIPHVFPDIFTTDPYSGEQVVNAISALFTIVDNDTGAAYPVGKTVKFRVIPSSPTVSPVLNTAAFNTYTSPFTLFSIIGQTAIYNPVIIISVKVFDPVNGDSGQIDKEFQTRELPQQ